MRRLRKGHPLRYRIPVCARLRLALIVTCALVGAAQPAFAFEPRPGATKVVILHNVTLPNATPTARLIGTVSGQEIVSYISSTVAYILNTTVEQFKATAKELSLDVSVRDEFDEIHLPGGTIDARLGTAVSLPKTHLRGPYAHNEAGTYVVQFAAPIDAASLKDIVAAGGTVVGYVPYNAYLVAGEPLALFAVSKLPLVQFVEVFHPALKDMALDRTRGVTHDSYVQLAATSTTSLAIARITTFSQTKVEQSADSPGQIRLRGLFDGSDLDRILDEPLVLGIEEVPTAAPSDERVATSLTTNVGPTGVPFSPKGYVAWLTNACAYCGSLRGDGFWAATADTGFADGPSGMGHPDLPIGRVRYGLAFNPVGVPGQDTVGHGTLVAGIIGGAPTSTRPSDADGFYYGSGVAPTVGIFATQVDLRGTATTPVFQSAPDARNATPPVYIQNHSYNQYTKTLCAVAYDGVYSQMSHDFDASVRHAGGSSGLPISLVASAGNRQDQLGCPSNPAPGNYTWTLPPATGKNVISVGAAESLRGPTEKWNCNGASDSFSNIVFDSKRGTVNPGWFKPELFAPASSVASTKSPSSTNHFCGDSNIPNLAEYLVGTGTSFAAPVATGAAVIASRVYAESINPNCRSSASCDPGAASPALLKAMLVMSAKSMINGIDRVDNSTIGPRPNAHQGFGRVHLEDLLSVYPTRSYVNQTQSIAGPSSAPWSKTYRAHDAALPVKIVLSWTDEPGIVVSNPSSTYNPLVNDLDLTVETGAPCVRFVGNSTGLFNSQRGEESISYAGCTGGTFDRINNTEMVIFYPGSAAQDFTVTVRYTSGATSQDFGLVVYNGYDPSDAPPATPVVAATASSAAQVAVSWPQVAGSGVTYEVQRLDAQTDYVTVTSTAGLSFADTNVIANSAYVYRVRAKRGIQVSQWSTPDAATTVTFSTADASLVLSPARVHVADIMELRTAANALLAAAKTAPYAFVDPTLIDGTTQQPVRVRATHIYQLRSAIDAARGTLHLGTVAYTDNTLCAPGQPSCIGEKHVRDDHIIELRNAVR